MKDQEPVLHQGNTPDYDMLVKNLHDIVSSIGVIGIDGVVEQIIGNSALAIKLFVLLDNRTAACAYCGEIRENQGQMNIHLIECEKAPTYKLAKFQAAFRRMKQCDPPFFEDGDGNCACWFCNHYVDQADAEDGKIKHKDDCPWEVMGGLIDVK